MQRSRNSDSKRTQKRDTRKQSNSGSEDHSDSERKPQKSRTSRRDSPSESKSVSRSRSRSRSESGERPSRGAPKQQVQRKTGEDCSELFVRNLPWKADEESISDYFSKYGKVQNVKILFNRETGKAKGIGFVDFATREEAQNAINNAADLELDGRKIEVSFSNQKEQRSDDRGGNRDSGRDSGRDNRDSRGGDRRDTRRDDRPKNAESNTLFVGNLDFKTSEGTIRDFFDDCGGIVDVRIAKTPEGKNKGFAHVEFDNTDAASKAMKKAGENIDGRDIRLDFSAQRQAGGDRDRSFGGGSRGGFRGGSSKKIFKFFYFLAKNYFYYIYLIFLRKLLK